MITSTSSRHRRWLATCVAAVTAVAAAGLVAAPSASAAVGDVEPGSGGLAWGFRESFRNYVGNQTGAPPAAHAPIAERITPTGGATFDPAGSAIPATSVAGATLPYLFPVAGGTYADSTNFAVELSGGVSYYFPGHTFAISFANMTVVANGGTFGVVADVTSSTLTGSATQAGSQLPPWTVSTGPTVTEDVVIAELDATTGSFSASVTGGTLSLTATDLVLTSAASVVLNGYLGAGDPLDDLALTATIERAPGALNPQVAVSKNWVAASGDTITVTLDDFDPTLLGNGAPRSNQPGGYYVVLGSFADNWRLTQGYPSSARPNIAQRWAIPAKTDGSNPEAASGGAYVELTAAGDATVTFELAAFDPSALVNGLENFGVYTYPASIRQSGGVAWTPSAADWAARAPYETFTPLNIVSSAGSQTIIAEVEHTAAGSFGWTIEENDPVDLGTLVNADGTMMATGSINPVTVTDTRIYQANDWSISGVVSDFSNGTDSIPASSLSWAPTIVTPGAGAVAGSAAGLGAGTTLASAPIDHQPGTAELGAGLTLRVPWDTPEGTYTATLTLTALS